MESILNGNPVTDARTRVIIVLAILIIVIIIIQQEFLLGRRRSESGNPTIDKFWITFVIGIATLNAGLLACLKIHPVAILLSWITIIVALG